ncbi:MAG: lactate utilization protein [Bacteroidales bacterium]
MMNPIDVRNELWAKRIIKALQSRHFDAYYGKTKEEALALALSLIPTEDVVSWGGSVTLSEIGLIDMVRRRFKVIDRETGTTPEEKACLMRQGMLADTFLMSTNALSEDGQLLNIDGTGNRLAAMMFGPKNVVVVAGMNKVCKNVEEAAIRVRSIAAPINAQRLATMNPPCKETGVCLDCKSPESMCSYVVTTRLSRPAHRIKVILVGESLGY